MTGPQLVAARSLLAVVLVAGALDAMPGLSALHAQGTSEPQVLYWESDTPPNTGTAVGMLYTPRVLSSLASRIGAGAVPPAIADAIAQRTPIVVMWDLPGPASQPPWQIAIERGSKGTETPIKPVWIQQHAGDMERLDRRLGSGSRRVAAIAAFPASAFVPGRRVVIRSARRLTDSGSETSSQRWGVVRWDGRAGQ